MPQTHGHRRGKKGEKGTWNPTYGTWREMKRRCLDPNRPDFKYYGARQIQVCPQWLAKPGGFEQFLADVGPRPDGHSLDRIDAQGHYEPGNVRWRPTLENCADNRFAKWDTEAYGPYNPEENLVEPKWPELLVKPISYQSPPEELEKMPF